MVQREVQPRRCRSAHPFSLVALSCEHSERRVRDYESLIGKKYRSGIGHSQIEGSFLPDRIVGHVEPLPGGMSSNPMQFTD